MKCSHHPARSNTSTGSTQRQSQQTRQQIAIHAQRDYEECPWYHKLFLTYHGSSIRHIEPCKAKYNTRAHEEARSQAERIRTPTPDPYTPVLSEVEMDVDDVDIGDIGTGVWVSQQRWPRLMVISVDIPSNSPVHLDTVIDETTPHSICSSPPHSASSTSFSDGDGGDTGVSAGLNALIQTPLQPGKTLIIYHPHAQHPPDIVDTTALSQTREPQPFLPLEQPWAPFGSCDDFEQAELFIKHNCTNRLINDQLCLNQKQYSHDHPGDPPLMKNAREMHRVLEEAGSEFDVSSVCWICSYLINSTEVRSSLRRLP